MPLTAPHQNLLDMARACREFGAVSVHVTPDSLRVTWGAEPPGPLAPVQEPVKPRPDPELCACGHDAIGEHTPSGLCSRNCPPENCHG